MSQCSAFAATVKRRRSGPLLVVEARRAGLTEFHITGTSDGSTSYPPAAQASEIYEAVASLLAQEDAQGVQERIFGSLECQAEVTPVRERLLPKAAWSPTYIHGAPPDRVGIAGVHLYAVKGPEVKSVEAGGEHCGLRFSHGNAEHTYLSAPTGDPVGWSRATCAQQMFSQVREALSNSGAPYTDVVRTWIYVADILDWYDEFNAIRSPIYRELGLMPEGGSCRVPASTGIEGQQGDGAQCTMDVYAVSGPGRDAMEIVPLHNPLQNEAYAYGSAFARGMSVSYDGIDTAFISGTASIDEEGRSVHLDDLEQQVRRTIENIRALIGTRGFTLADMAVSNTFVKHGQSAQVVRRVLAEEGVALADGVVVAADVCRHDLLFEIDGLAVRAT